MSSRRQFLTTGLMAVGAWSFSREVEAGRRRRRCYENRPGSISPNGPATSEREPQSVVPKTPTIEQKQEIIDLNDRSAEKFIQPNSTRWLLLEIGMTEREVLALLGEPLKRLDQTEWYRQRFERLKDKQSDALPNSWTYGWLKFDSPAFPNSPEYNVWFRAGKVAFIEEPFNGEVSPQGKPTTPKLILPQDRTTFHHYPRWLDMRWYPTAGDYPQKYDIEIESSVAIGDSELLTTVLRGSIE
jgi:hypothetical protein